MSVVAPHNPFRSSPLIPSPLASASDHPPSSQTTPRRSVAFPSSRPLRPFPAGPRTFQQPAVPKVSGSNLNKPVKLIEPPKNHKATFVLNLTQAEFSRRL
jgi:hypothetical protein